ncbi:DUF1989 domain-containing protein [Embleya scabrispora]|uniref:DUF1989 domain-containing protein n=1 Tax=Embleya scabrispora TaxID=159449 RepID=UPI000378563E|nr:urea carboxylase-associated family protein [Embleya scabrispora]MYS80478.1 DUF1989 domain-containing protein [Streptomyces sp. SID5474]
MRADDAPENETGPARRVVVPAGRGAAVEIRCGQTIRVVNTSGTQVVDLWAHARDDPREYLGLSQCREVLQRIHFRKGDVLSTNRYRACLTVLDDTSGIDHDTLIAPCRAETYLNVGLPVTHRSCTANHAQALPRWPAADPPQPWNLFMTAEVGPGGEIVYKRPPFLPAMYVELRAEMDLTLVVSSCPDDHYPTNGGDGSPQDFEILVAP